MSVRHSVKGSSWKKHKYLAIVDGKYIYPGDEKKTSKQGSLQKTASSPKTSLNRSSKGEYERFRNPKYKTVIDKIEVVENKKSQSTSTISKKKPAKISSKKVNYSSIKKKPITTPVSKKASDKTLDAIRKVANVSANALKNAVKESKSRNTKKGVDFGKVYGVYKKRR